MPGVDRRLLQNFDWVLFALACTLAAIGIANLISATYTGSGQELSPAVRRQLVSLGLGGLGLVAAAAFDYRHLERFAPSLYALTLLAVASTLVLAPVTRGSQSWLVYGPLRLQPSELAKLGMVLALARFFHRNPPDESSRLGELWKPAAIVALPVALIVLQRDKGVALLTLLIGATYVPFVRMGRRMLAGLALAAMAGLPALWIYALEPYQRSRLLDFIDPGRDPLASGYQAIQSKIAVGAGGLFGAGYLQGTQTQLDFLPTQHTDFVFSVLAEEWGFVGCCVVLLLYLALLLWGLYIARNSKESFGALLAVGLVGTFFWPAAINIAMVLGLAPVIGVPLPLLSYGGSALVTSLIGLGLLLNISMRRYMF